MGVGSGVAVGSGVGVAVGVGVGVGGIGVLVGKGLGVSVGTTAGSSAWPQPASSNPMHTKTIQILFILFSFPLLVLDKRSVFILEDHKCQNQSLNCQKLPIFYCHKRINPSEINIG
jgi:hypothetical protein